MSVQIDRNTEVEKTEGPSIILSVMSGYVPCQSQYQQTYKVLVQNSCIKILIPGGINKAQKFLSYY